MRIFLLQMLVMFVYSEGHRTCQPNSCDKTCHFEFSKYDANTFLSNGKRSTPRECCHESNCEELKGKCWTEQYRAYIVNKKSYWCPAGKVVAITDWCKNHFKHECKDICESLGTRCENGGTCVPTDRTNYTCRCKSGFEGETCQVNIKECKPNHCNKTTSIRCIDRETCQCKPGYTGKTCNIDFDDCSNSPCKNGSTCIDHVNNFSCICKPGYTGTFCDQDIDECASSPCQNGATCLNKKNLFKCKCPPRIYGVLCDTNFCHPTPADVVFVLDSSISMSEQQFQQQLEFVANFSSQVSIGPRDFQISVVTFSSVAHVEFYLNQYKDNTSVIDAVMNITYKPGATRTDLGLKAVETLLDGGPGTERRINNTQANRFVYVLTDGMSSKKQSTKDVANYLKDQIVDSIAAIGIGYEVSHQELVDIASDPSFVYSVKNFNSLYTVLKRLVYYLCDGKECENSAASDVAIFLDSSYSMTANQYDASKDAIFHIIDVMKSLGFNETRVSVTSFSDVICTVLSMGETFDKNEIKVTINPIDQSTVNSQIPIESVYMHVRTKEFTSTKTRENAKKFLLIFTNGNHVVKDQHELEREMSLLEADEVNIVAVGSGENVTIRGMHRLVKDNFDVFITNKDLPLSSLDVLQSEFVYNKCDLKGE